MPISRLRLYQFRCFEDSGEIPLAPLTLIFGRNNTGKSSILQSLLLLRQSVDSPVDAGRVNLQGPLYPAGSFADIVHQHRSKQRVAMSFDVEIGSGNEKAELALEFASDEPRWPRVTHLKIRGYQKEEVVEFGTGRGRGGPLALFIGGENLGSEDKANFRFSVNQFFPLIGNEPRRRGRPNAIRQAAREFARRVLSEFEQTLQSLRVVGAFRTRPERRYEYQAQPSAAADVYGENVINALIEDWTRRRKPKELFRSVNKWLVTLGGVRLLPLRRLSRGTGRLWEIRLKDVRSGRWANFADVGFGIGQALPVFVEGLRTPRGGTFIVQEPEIHLHPDAQLAMADFLIALAKTGRRVIAETHSEHILLRARKAVAASNGWQRGRFGPKDLSIVYVDKPSDGGSHATPLEIDQLGQIKNWPKGFMEEATKERIAFLQEAAKRAEAGRA